METRSYQLDFCFQRLIVFPLKLCNFIVPKKIISQNHPQQVKLGDTSNNPKISFWSLQRTVYGFQLNLVKYDKSTGQTKSSLSITTLKTKKSNEYTNQIITSKVPLLIVKRYVDKQSICSRLVWITMGRCTQYMEMRCRPHGPQTVFLFS